MFFINWDYVPDPVSLIQGSSRLSFRPIPISLSFQRRILKKKKERNYIAIIKDSEKKVKVTQSCPTLCDPMDSTVHGILLVRILKWVAFPFSRGASQTRGRTQVSHIAGGFFTNWATRASHNKGKQLKSHIS